MNTNVRVQDRMIELDQRQRQRRKTARQRMLARLQQEIGINGDLTLLG